jgi:hypothetical protein
MSDLNQIDDNISTSSSIVSPVSFSYEELSRRADPSVRIVLIATSITIVPMQRAEVTLS